MEPVTGPNWNLYDAQAQIPDTITDDKMCLLRQMQVPTAKYQTELITPMEV